MDFNILLILSLFVIGFLYASVGHGGASGYLAVLSIFGIAVLDYKPIILILNILVAGMGFIQFSRAGYFKWKLTLPFLITSIPMAFLGSKLAVKGDLYNLLLGLALVVPVIRLLGFTPVEQLDRKEVKIYIALFIGALIGFLSGMLNIGGGIFLSPVLILLAWADAKEAAASSALFIVLNSISGLIGYEGLIDFNLSTSAWFIAALSGGIAGAYWGSQRFKVVTVRYLLTAVLAIASVKLLFFM